MTSGALRQDMGPADVGDLWQAAELLSAETAVTVEVVQLATCENRVKDHPVTFLVSSWKLIALFFKKKQARFFECTTDLFFSGLRPCLDRKFFFGFGV